VAEIKNIIFDLGGVIIHLAYERTREAFIRLGVADFDTIYSKSQQSGLFDAIKEKFLLRSSGTKFVSTYHMR
jgi:FMN phosphatase YigB (HAD superfamily)